jgi:diguanylate cyclase (GGDEF)-like protein/PAS domain S-box-containing protein
MADPSKNRRHLPGKPSARAGPAAALKGESVDVMPDGSHAELMESDSRFRTMFEEALRDSQQSFQLLFAQNPQPMWVCDLETLEFLEVNHAAIAHYGYTRDEFLSMRITDIRLPEDLQRLLDEVAGVHDGLNQSDPRKHRLKDGRLIDVEVISHTLQFAGRNATLCLLQDVTERSRVREELTKERGALAESEARFRAIFERAAMGVSLADRDGYLVMANPALHQMLGYEDGELTGKRFSTITHPDDLEINLSLHEEMVAGNRDRYQLEKRYIRKDGAVLWGRITVSSIRDAVGQFTFAVGMAEDITRQKAAEEAQSRLVAIVEASDDAIMSETLDGIVTSWNRGAEQLYGYTAEEVIGERIDILEPEDRVGEIGTLIEGIGRGAPLRRVETRRRAKDGREIDVSLTISAIYDEAGKVIGSSAIARDITERKRAEATLEHQALHDSLTGLPNRTLLRDRLEQAIRHGRRDRSVFAFLLLDLDRFKEVNDTLGHQVGDQLLQEVASRIEGALRESDTVARLGGDEFAVICVGAGPDVAISTVSRIQSTLSQSLVLDGLRIGVGASIGIAYYPDHGEDASTLLRHADIAMYAAKRTSSRSRVYNPEREQITPVRLSLVADLRYAIRHGQLVLHYQPKVDLATRRVLAVEALVRWQHPERGLIAPQEFIPVAETTGLMEPLSRWVIDASLRQCAAWSHAGLDLRVAVNLPVHSLVNLDLPRIIGDLACNVGVDPSRLIVEITEGSLMEDSEQTIEILRSLHDLGISVSIDDFGTGYSSLAYLKQLPVDEIKIDRSFVVEMTQTGNVIIRSIVDLAQKLGLDVTGEGVEDETTLEALAAMGCDMAQGYHLSRPLPGDQIPDWIRRFQFVPVPTRKAGGTILVVDDNPVYQDLLRVILTNDGYTVTAVGDADEAIEVLGSMTPDLILTDVRLPGRSGLDLIRYVREEMLLDDTVTIAITGTPQPADEEQARRVGCDVYTSKPSSNAELSLLVHKSFVKGGRRKAG